MDIVEKFGEKIFMNGDVYSGYYKGSLPHGKGKYTWSDGTVYEGDWEEGKMTGKGKISWPSGAIYDGDFWGGYLHGFGTYIRSDGSIYKGDWKMNSQHGFGRKQYSDLDIFEGIWKEGAREGTGRYDWSTGEAYNGNWQSGKMSGRGLMRWSNVETFDGFWKDGSKHGPGLYRLSDGSYYIGTWFRDLKDGRGTLCTPGVRHPSLKKWCNSGGCHCGYKTCYQCKDSVAEKKFVKNISPHSCCMPSVFRSLSWTPNKTISVEDRKIFSPMDLSRDGDYSHMLSPPSDDDEGEILRNGHYAIEREYVEGILIKENVRNFKALSKHWKWKRNVTLAGANPCLCLKKIRVHQNLHWMINLQLGIRYTVGKITSVPLCDVRSCDFGKSARLEIYFPGKGSRISPPHCSVDFYWKDYCSVVFRNLREMFGLDAAEYMMSICCDDCLRELPSPGKSGSIFFLSQDNRFVIKTLRRYELKTLLRMLPNYYNHVRQHENTLVTKFFGLHSIKPRGGKKARFVVMGNIFHTDLRINHRYDLKGSTQGRCASVHETSGSIIIKDLDLSYVFHMDKSLRDSFLKQVSLDCNFLESQQIIDYSLLLGLHFRVPELLKSLLNLDNTHATNGAAQRGELLISPDGHVLIIHESDSTALQGPHIRGSRLRALSMGNQEVDLLMPGIGRYPVRLGVNMPAKAVCRGTLGKTGPSGGELFEAHDVVLYMGIIDILQEYDLKKRTEHTCKSLRFQPLSISAVEPKLYSKRLISFLENVFPDSA